MKKIAIVYWSGTGNTQAMAEAVLAGANAAGAAAVMQVPAEFNTSALSSLDAIAFGCPAMGSEALEETEFEPMFTSLVGALGGKRIALFGSYGWGDGEWMRSWEKECDDAGANRVCDSVICNEAPDDAAIQSCKSLGTALAN